MRRAVRLLVLLPLALARCGSSGSTGGPATDGGSADAPALETGTDAAAACSVEALAEPRAAKTLYVAIAEPGADNDQCDGTSPTNAGGGHCPFKDLDAARVRTALDSGGSVRVE